jgi:hypothetical protein
MTIKTVTLNGCALLLPKFDPYFEPPRGKCRESAARRFAAALRLTRKFGLRPEPQIVMPHKLMNAFFGLRSGRFFLLLLTISLSVSSVAYW